MKRSLCPGGETLIAYQDGDLTPARQAHVAAHVRGCPVCRGRLRDSETIGRLLRTHIPLIEDPIGMRMVKDSVRFVTPAPSRPARTPAWRPVAAACLLVAVLAVAFQLQPTTADFRLGRFVEFITDRGHEAPHYTAGEGQPPGTPLTGAEAASNAAAVSFRPVVPAVLPLGLVLDQQDVTDADRLILFYDQGGELAIRVVEEAATHATTSAQSVYVEVVTLQGTEVAIERNALGAVARLVWERQGIVFDVVILQAPATGLSDADALLLAEALIAAQLDD
jgi:hypothetical protein